MSGAREGFEVGQPARNGPGCRAEARSRELPMSSSLLNVRVDPASGQLRAVSDPRLDLQLLSYPAGAEIELNGRALTTRLVKDEGKRGEQITTMDACELQGYMAGQRFEIRRYITLGGEGLHTGPSNSLHIRYHLRRVPWGDWRNEMDMIWGPPLEAPLRVDTLSVLGASTEWFGPATRMRAVALGGSGPREHEPILLHAPAAVGGEDQVAVVAAEGLEVHVRGEAAMVVPGGDLPDLAAGAGVVKHGARAGQHGSGGGHGRVPGVGQRT
jgi:hypothetical protein